MNLKIGHHLDASTWRCDDCAEARVVDGPSLGAEPNGGQRGSPLRDSRITSSWHQSDRAEQTR